MNILRKSDFGIVSILLVNIYIGWSLISGDIALKEALWIHLWSIIVLSFLYFVFVLLFGKIFQSMGRDLIASFGVAFSLFLLGFIFFIYATIIGVFFIDLISPKRDVDSLLIFNTLKIVTLAHLVTLTALRFKATNTHTLQKKWASLLFAEGTYGFIPILSVGIIAILLDGTLSSLGVIMRPTYSTILYIATFLVTRLISDIDTYNILRGKRTYILPDRRIWDKGGKLKT